MVDIVLLQTVSIAIASVGVFLAAVYYILQIRHQAKARQTDLILRLYSTFGGEDHQRAGKIIWDRTFIQKSFNHTQTMFYCIFWKKGEVI